MTELTVYITADEDSIFYNSGGLVTNSNYLIAGDLNAPTYDYVSLMRFLDVTIPQGMIIYSAELHLYTQGSYGTDWETKLKGEDADNSEAYTDKANAEARARTEACVDYNPDTWGTGGDKILNVRSIIQEIVNRSGWASGNALTIFWYDGQGAGFQSQKMLIACSHRGSYQEPYLVIEYSDEPFPLLTVPATASDLDVSPESTDIQAENNALLFQANELLPSSVDTVEFNPTDIITNEDSDSITDENSDPITMDYDYLGKAKILAAKKPETLFIVR